MSIPKFGFLAPDSQSEDLPVGTDLQLPLWAARVLCRPGRNYVSVVIPPGFKDAHREVIDDEPTTADLKKVHTQYYEAGHLCTSLYHYDAGELAEMLPEILQQRILCIGESTITNPSNRWVQQVMSPKAIPPKFLDKLEEKIFEDSKNGTKNIQEWLDPVMRPLPPDMPITRSVRPRPAPPPQPQVQQLQPAQRYHPTSQRIGSGNQYASPAPPLSQAHSHALNYHLMNTNVQPHPGLPVQPQPQGNAAPPHGNYSHPHYHQQHHQNMR